jgi:hypothetical protein
MTTTHTAAANARSTRRRTLAALVARAAATAAAAALLLASPAAAALEQLSPPEGFPGIEFKHLAMNSRGQFVAVSGSQVYAGDAVAGRIERVLANDRLGFVLTESATHGAHDQTHRLQLDVLSTRLAINENGDYVLASHTTLLVGNAGGGEPRRVYEDSSAMFQRVAINSGGHYAALSRRTLVAGTVGGAAATRLVMDAPGTFLAHDVDGANGNWSVEVGESHLALNEAGQFVAASGRAVYGGSVPALTVQKLHEDSRVGFRHVQLSPSGHFVAVSVRNVFRGKL